MRHFVFSQVQQLLADDLGNDQSLRLIGNHVVGVIFRTDRQEFFDLVEEIVDVGSVRRADRNDRRETSPRGVFGEDRQQFFAIEQIDLVDDQNHRTLGRLQPLENVFLAAAEFFIGVDHKQNYVDFFQRTFRRAEHVFAELELRFMNAGRVEENHLRVVDCQNALNARARRLRLIGSDRDLLPDQSIDQRRLADIRTSDHRREAGLEFRAAHLITITGTFAYSTIF